MNNNPLISVLILNWNRLEDTKRAIESVLTQTYTNIEIILIDNASTETGTDTLKVLYPQIEYHQLDKNYGCPGGRNIGIKLCRGEYIFFVDNDGILEKNAIKNAYDIFTSRKNVGIVAGKIIFQQSLDGELKSPDIRGIAYYKGAFSGGITMHKKSIYDKIGLFNDDFMYGHEETNLSMRLLTINQYVYYSDNIILWHKEADTARNKSVNFVSTYSNKLVTYWELLPAKQYLIFTLYYLTKYPINCYQNDCLLLFIKKLPSTFRRVIKAKKESKIRLTAKDYKMFRHLLTNTPVEII